MERMMFNWKSLIWFTLKAKIITIIKGLDRNFLKTLIVKMTHKYA